MPSPFPGMDPYLETSRFWRGFHNGLIFNLQAALNAVLPSGFAANYEERVVILPPERPIYPDVLVGYQTDATRRGGATAVLEAGAAHGVLVAYPEELREGFVEIRSADAWEQIVAIIEVLSPANKMSGSVGRAEYLQKQQDLLHSRTHLMEIDLLRGGTHTAAAPLARLREEGHWDGLICLHRSTQRYHFEYWFTALRDPLPPVRVPLTADQPDVLLDLQAVFTATYDAGPYARLIRYQEEPPISLEAEDAVWMEALLREKGLRP